MTKNNHSHLKAWFALSDDTKRNVYTQAGNNIGLPAFAIEKDWWVVHTLLLLFNTSYAPFLIFKGGTSLSKAWSLIERFSEDIDVVIDRKCFGKEGNLTPSGIRKLRKDSQILVATKLLPELTTLFQAAGLKEFDLRLKEPKTADEDPTTIEIYFPKLTEENTYLKPDISIEIGSRSLKEPNSIRPINTIVAEQFQDQPFINSPFTIPVVNPERTFLEKVILLHEEFKRPPEKIRVDRLSRHLYDIEKMSKTQYAQTAMQSTELFSIIVAHRQIFSPVQGTDYENLTPDQINFLPPKHLIDNWAADYAKMLESMIYDKGKLPFTELLNSLESTQQKINAISNQKNQSTDL